MVRKTGSPLTRSPVTPDLMRQIKQLSMRHTEQFRHAEHPVEKEIGIIIVKEDFSRLPFEDLFVFLHDITPLDVF